MANSSSEFIKKIKKQSWLIVLSFGVLGLLCLRIDHNFNFNNLAGIFAIIFLFLAVIFGIWFILTERIKEQYEDINKEREKSYKKTVKDNEKTLKTLRNCYEKEVSYNQLRKETKKTPNYPKNELEGTLT